jgi:serine/threonine-protein kinase
VDTRIIEQLGKILASRFFVKSERLSRFLRFCVEQALAGREDQLKESVLGVEVFDRPASYDPRIDPIVRVEARRLRAKLRAYYEAEGAGDAVWIEFPTGSYVPRFRTDGAPPLPPPPETTAAASPETIVVLPFVNLSSDPENEYFSDGLTEELIHALTKVECLRVVAASSVMQLKGKPYDFRAIGERLKVRSVLEGSVRKSGSRLRITVQLIDAANSHYLWSETYDRQMQDLFAIQEEIARTIVAKLRIQLAGEQHALLAAPSSANVEAYNLYLKGRHQYNLRTEDGLTRSIEFYQQAIVLDPGCARCFAGMAHSYAALGIYGMIHPREVMEKARTSARRALELDPTLAEAHMSLAFVEALYEWSWEKAEEHYLRALELSPGYVDAHFFYGCDFLAQQGRLDEAYAHTRKAVELDPLSIITACNLVTIYIMRREYDQAIEECRRLLEMDPNYYKIYTSLGRAYTQKGMYDAAIETFQKARSLSGDLPYITAIMAHAYALAGQRKQAEKLQRELRRTARWRYVPSSSFALIAIGLGDFDEAFALLEKSADEREGPILLLGVYPTYDCLRSDPRYHALLRRMGLPMIPVSAKAIASPAVPTAK